MMVHASMDVSSNVDIHGWAKLFGYRTIPDLPSGPTPTDFHPTPLPVRHPARSSPEKSNSQRFHPREELLAAPGEQGSCLSQANQEKQETMRPTKVRARGTKYPSLSPCSALFPPNPGWLSLRVLAPMPRPEGATQESHRQAHCNAQ